MVEPTTPHNTPITSRSASAAIEHGTSGSSGSTPAGNSGNAPPGPLGLSDARPSRLSLTGAPPRRSRLSQSSGPRMESPPAEPVEFDRHGSSSSQGSVSIAEAATAAAASLAEGEEAEEEEEGRTGPGSSDESATATARPPDTGAAGRSGSSSALPAGPPSQQADVQEALATATAASEPAAAGDASKSSPSAPAKSDQAAADAAAVDDIIARAVSAVAADAVPMDSGSSPMDPPATKLSGSSSSAGTGVPALEPPAAKASAEQPPAHSVTADKAPGGTASGSTSAVDKPRTDAARSTEASAAKDTTSPDDMAPADTALAGDDKQSVDVVPGHTAPLDTPFADAAPQTATVSTPAADAGSAPADKAPASKSLADSVPGSAGGGKEPPADTPSAAPDRPGTAPTQQPPAATATDDAFSARSASADPPSAMVVPSGSEPSDEALLDVTSPSKAAFGDEPSDYVLVEPPSGSDSPPASPFSADDAGTALTAVADAQVDKAPASSAPSDMVSNAPAAGGPAPDDKAPAEIAKPASASADKAPAGSDKAPVDATADDMASCGTPPADKTPADTTPAAPASPAPAGTAAADKVVAGTVSSSTSANAKGQAGSPADSASARTEGSSSSAAAPTTAPITASTPAPAAAPPKPNAGPSLPPRAAKPKPSSTSTAPGNAPSALKAPATGTPPASSPAPTTNSPSSAPRSLQSSASAGQLSSNSSPPAAAGSGTSGGAASSSSSPSGGTATAAPDTPAPKKSAGMPSLPPRSSMPLSGPVLDPEESEETVRVRHAIHAVRVQMIRSAMRLGYTAEHGIVMQVLYRLDLAEKIQAPRRPQRAGTRRLDPAKVAAFQAAKLESEEGSDAALGFSIKIMLIGMQGTGKTQLAQRLLGRKDAVCPFEGASKKVEVLKGTVFGINMQLVDTPGLIASAGGARHNGWVVQQICSAFNRHKPDLIIYVDRLDGRPRATPAQLPSLSALTQKLGAPVWLNTIFAFTHAGAAPPKGMRGMDGMAVWDEWATKKAHALQQVVRDASGDSRLMNPVVYAETHPNARTNAQGQALTHTGMPWEPQMYLMIISAKLLADAENLLKAQGGGGGGGAHGAALPQHLMMQEAMGGRQIPVPYIMQQFTQFSKPMKYADHHAVMEVRHARASLGKEASPQARREGLKRIQARVRGLRQSAVNSRRMYDTYRQSTLAGGKLVPEPPNIAIKQRPTVQPPPSHRYKVLEPPAGWMVKPQVEQHVPDESDGVVGLLVDGSGAFGSDGLEGHGVPYHHFMSFSCSKDQRMVASRSEATVYLDPLGKYTASLSSEVQTSATPGTADVMAVLRCDCRARSYGGRLPKVTAGALVAKVAEERRPHVGPTAVGMRLQMNKKGQVGMTPLKATACAAVLRPLNGPGEGETCLGGNMQLGMDIGEILDVEQAVPFDLGLNMMRHKGATQLSTSAAVQVATGQRDMVAVRVTGSQGRAALSLKWRSGEHLWAGPLAMAVPLGQVLLQKIAQWRARSKK